MPLPSLHPLPNNPTTGQAPLANLRSGPPPASAAGGGGVNRETLKGLQDVVWSDDEDDPDCLLCAEPLDLSDLNFKPCQCGMQICQFCYNKLLTSDSRCPGCRRPYDAKAVVFQPVDWEEVKRAKEKKTRRAKTIKQLTSMGRRHLLAVRIVMKNMVCVVGMKLPAPEDEAIPILRSNDYFGQYGKIAKLYLRDRTTLTSTQVHTLDDEDDSSTSTGIYIIYVRREDAARAIMALDGIQSPQGPPGQVLRATYGTTRYCDWFLRGMKCDTQNCTSLHEWGGDGDCFTKEDFETALTRPAEYDARQKQAQIAAPPLSQKSAWPKPAAVEDAIGASALPNSAAWGKNIPIARPANRVPTTAPIGSSRPTKPLTFIPAVLPLKSNAAFPLPTPSPIIPPLVKEKKERNRQSATAMARGKSNDSSLSATTSSAQTSPKRKPSALAPISKTNNVSAPPPEPLEVKTAADQPDLTESVSAESEAGPSSASPAPQTPARLTDTEVPPPPLTSEPIFVHSPYEEPRLFSFPSIDPGFAFSLALDEGEMKRQSQDITYRPSPFSKTLVGLAEMGVLSPEMPDLISTPPVDSFTGSFQPFDNLDEGLGEGSTSGSGSGSGSGGGARGEAEIDGPRTTSRFDFARPSSRSTTGRGQSPFAVRRSMEDRDRDAWGLGAAGSGRLPGLPQHQLHSQQHGGQQQSQHGLDDRQHPLAAQVASFVGSYGSDWGHQSVNYSVESTFNSGSGRGERYGKGGRDRDDYDPEMTPFGTSSRSAGLFSPETSRSNPHPQQSHQQQPQHHSLEQDFNSVNSPHNHSQTYQLHSHSPAHGFDARIFGTGHRTGSPTPLSQGFRRF